MNRRRLGRWLAAALIGGCVLVGLAVAFPLVRAQRAAPASSAVVTPGVGTARLLGGVATAPFAVSLGNVQRSEVGAELLISMTATFANQGAESYRADPGDFRLRDARGDAWPTSLGAGPPCAAWSVTPVSPGSDFGPVPLCFRTGAALPEPVVVLWHPDVSFFLFGGPAAVIPLPEHGQGST